MNRAISLVAAVAVCAACTTALGLYGVIDKGTWPKSWPKQLEPLRQQARTYEGPEAPFLHYAIHFADRGQFESAWPHILKVKTKGAPVILVRGANFFLGDGKAGVVVHSPPAGGAENPARQADNSAAGEPPIKGEGPIKGKGQIKGAPVAGEDPIERGRPIAGEGPIEGVEDARMRWMNTTYIELVVDGQIVDLNRIPLPGDTPIVDERFSEGKEASSETKR